jgi:hypothetical protein
LPATESQISGASVAVSATKARVPPRMEYADGFVGASTAGLGVPSASMRSMRLRKPSATTAMRLPSGRQVTSPTGRSRDFAVRLRGAVPPTASV